MLIVAREGLETGAFRPGHLYFSTSPEHLVWLNAENGTFAFPTNDFVVKFPNRSPSGDSERQEIFDLLIAGLEQL